MNCSRRATWDLRRRTTACGQTLLAGVPLVVFPAAGFNGRSQNRVARQGSGRHSAAVGPTRHWSAPSARCCRRRAGRRSAQRRRQRRRRSRPGAMEAIQRWTGWPGLGRVDSLEAAHGKFNDGSPCGSARPRRLGAGRSCVTGCDGAHRRTGTRTAGTRATCGGRCCVDFDVPRGTVVNFASIGPDASALERGIVWDRRRTAPFPGGPACARLPDIEHLSPMW